LGSAEIVVGVTNEVVVVSTTVDSSVVAPQETSTNVINTIVNLFMVLY
jgi:hypothetical protein